MLKKMKFLAMTPCTWMALIVAICALAGAVELPPYWGNENGPLELLQLVILGCCCLAVLLVVNFGVVTKAYKKLFLCSIPIWILMIGREISWGRDFYINSAGEMPRLVDLWYGPYVHPTVAIVAIITLWGLSKYGVWIQMRNWLNYGIVPVGEIGIIIVAGVIATCVEHYSHGLFSVSEELFEELAEVVCYSAILLFIIDVGFNKIIQPASRALPRKFLPNNIVMQSCSDQSNSGYVNHYTSR